MLWHAACFRCCIPAPARFFDECDGKAAPVDGQMPWRLAIVGDLRQNISSIIRIRRHTGEPLQTADRHAGEKRAMSLEVATFRLGPLVNLPTVLASLDADPEAILARNGFEPADLSCPDTRISYIQGGKLLADCVATTGCQELGFLIGQQGCISHLGIAGFIARAAPKVEVALRSLISYLDLHEDSAILSLTVGERFTTLGYFVGTSDLDGLEQISDLATVMMYQFMRALCGKNWVASTVNLQRRTPADREPYVRFFCCPVFFDSADSSISFSNEYLLQDSMSADELLFEYLVHEADALHNLQRHQLMDELPSVLIKALLNGQSTARQVASVFGLQERTFHRRLHAAGTSFRTELDRARRLVSEQLLVGTELPVSDIAGALGYADSSGFIRAFQRWSGISPSAWRNRSRLQ
jgi:AraC-like DNA-binding protein